MKMWHPLLKPHCDPAQLHASGCIILFGARCHCILYGWLVPSACMLIQVTSNLRSPVCLSSVPPHITLHLTPLCLRSSLPFQMAVAAAASGTLADLYVPCFRSHGTPHKWPWQNMLHNLPNHVFDASTPHRHFNMQTRLMGLATKAAELSLVGSIAGASMSLLNQGCVAAHRYALLPCCTVIKAAAPPVQVHSTSQMQSAVFSRVASQLPHQSMGLQGPYQLHQSDKQQRIQGTLVLYKVC